MTDYIIRMEKANVAIDDKYWLRPCTLDIEAGKKVALVGRMGSGKTTMLRMLGGFYFGYDGELLIDGLKIGKETKGFTAFLGDLDSLPYELPVKKTREIYSTFFYDFDEEKFERLIEEFGIDEEKAPKFLNEGDPQKISLSLFMAREAKLFLLDQYREEDHIGDWYDMMGKILSEIPSYATLIFSSDDEGIIRKYADEVIYFEDRKVEDHLPTEEFFKKHGHLNELLKEEDDYEDLEDEVLELEEGGEE